MNTELWKKLEAFALDDPASGLKFSQRLARENGWSSAYTVRVLVEYKRFVYLMVEAGHPVTPSDDVDQAWHLHLCYTRSYWTELCGEVLGRPLHHGPTKGGRKEGAKFDDWYRRTLQSYLEHFSEDPPADIWPAPELRFRPANYRRIDTAANFVIPKRLVGLATSAGVLLVMLASCSGSADEREEKFWLAIIAFVVVGLVIYGFANGGKGGGGCSGGCGSSCGGCGGD